MATGELFHWPAHYDALRNAFNRMCSNGDYVDVTLWCEKRPIRAHKCVLAAGSDYFQRIFKDLSSQPQHQPHSVVVFENMRYEDLLAVVKYIYDGQILVPHAHRSAFMRAAQRFGVNIGQAMANPSAERDIDSGAHSVVTLSPEPVTGLQPSDVAATGKATKVASKRTSVIKLPAKPKKTAEVTFDAQVIAVLRDMRLETVDAFADKLLLLGDIYGDDRMQRVIYHIVDRATHFVRYGTVYVKLCMRLIEKEPASGDTAATESSLFRKQLLNHCHLLFTEWVLGDTQANDAMHRMRCLGLIRLIGLLYMHRLLFANILEWIIGALLEPSTAAKLEYLYELLAIVGKRVELQSGEVADDLQWHRDLSQCIETLKAALDDGAQEIQIDLRGRYRDLFESRSNGWAEPLHLILGDYGPVADRRKNVSLPSAPDESPIRSDSDDPAVNIDTDGGSSDGSRWWCPTVTPEEQKPIDLNASGTVRSIIESLRLFIRQRDEDVTGDAPMPSTIGEPTLDRGRSRAKKTNNATAYFD